MTTETLWNQLRSNILIQAGLVILLVWILYKIRIVLVILFFATILSSAFKPIVIYLQKRGAPKIVAILLPYFVVFVLFAIAGSLIVPTFVNQYLLLVSALPNLLSSFDQIIADSPLAPFVGSLKESISSLGQYAVSVPLTIVTAVISIFSTIVLSIYLLWDNKYLERLLVGLGVNKTKAPELLRQTELVMGRWVRGQVILSIVVGTLVSIGLFILGIQFPLALGIIAGLLEFIQFIGPVISAIIAMFVALNDSWISVGLVALLFFFIQQLENNFLVPQIMKRSVDLHPITVILLILAGGIIFGIIGAIIAVPLATVVKIIWNARIKAGQA